MKPKKICIVEGCSYPLFAKRYCSSHYKSLYLHPRIKKKQSIKIKSISAKKIIQIKELPNLLSYLKIMNNLNHEYYIRYCNNHNIDIPL